MGLIFFVGVFVIFCFVVGVIGALLYLYFGPHDDETCGVAMSAITLIILIGVVFSTVLTGFIFSPESYGYTKIQEVTIDEY